jgi:hypothetical protein
MRQEEACGRLMGIAEFGLKPTKRLGSPNW